MAPERKKEVPEVVLIVGKNIKSIIEQKDLKIRTVAHDANMDAEALRRYIRGQQTMGIDKLVTIAKALQVDVNELLKGII